VSIQISDDTIQTWIQDGIKQGIHSMLRDAYGNGAVIKRAIEKAVVDSEPSIVAAMKVGVAQACVSPDFFKSIESEIVKNMASRYRGVFDSVIHSAAKKAANDQITAGRIVELVHKAAMQTNGSEKP